jgi:hypothetical protein
VNDRVSKELSYEERRRSILYKRKQRLDKRMIRDFLIATQKRIDELRELRKKWEEENEQL